jgi:hypothetical protein
MERGGSLCLGARESEEWLHHSSHINLALQAYSVGMTLTVADSRHSEMTDRTGATRTERDVACLHEVSVSSGNVGRVFGGHQRSIERSEDQTMESILHLVNRRILKECLDI